MGKDINVVREPGQRHNKARTEGNSVWEDRRSGVVKAKEQVTLPGQQEKIGRAGDKGRSPRQNRSAPGSQKQN